MSLATDAPEVAVKGYISEDHSSLETEEEQDVTLAPSDLKADNGVSFKEEDHPEIASEEDVDARLPKVDLEEKGEGFIQSHVVTDTIIDDSDTTGGAKARESLATSQKVEFAQEVESKAVAAKSEADGVLGKQENQQSVHFLREIPNGAERTTENEQREMYAVEVTPRTTQETPPPWAGTTARESQRVATTRFVPAPSKSSKTQEADPMLKLESDLRDLRLLVNGISGSGVERRRKR